VRARTRRDRRSCRFKLPLRRGIAVTVAGRRQIRGGSVSKRLPGFYRRRLPGSSTTDGYLSDDQHRRYTMSPPTASRRANRGRLAAHPMSPNALGNRQSRCSTGGKFQSASGAQRGVGARWAGRGREPCGSCATHSGRWWPSSSRLWWCRPAKTARAKDPERHTMRRSPTAEDYLMRRRSTTQRAAVSAQSKAPFRGARYTRAEPA